MAPPHDREPRERLILFTRYPRAGTTKTRLIPVLGAQGAADLQRRMTQRILEAARRVAEQRSLVIEVDYSGGDMAAMAQWLGSDLEYRPQSSGDIGRRMAAALTWALTPPRQTAVLMGTDIPDITPEIITCAFDRLRQTDLVLGPTRDGGYYLIGMTSQSASRLLPRIFEGIAWSTPTVVAATREIARRLGATMTELPLLRDVDRPEDLAEWDRCCVRNGFRNGG
ncbi:MAG: TIGR04282 family arsenosugar biosynthesis glycosyltransferase [Desulfobacterales bacterium]